MSNLRNWRVYLLVAVIVAVANLVLANTFAWALVGWAVTVASAATAYVLRSSERSYEKIQTDEEILREFFAAAVPAEEESCSDCQCEPATEDSAAEDPAVTDADINYYQFAEVLETKQSQSAAEEIVVAPVAKKAAKPSKPAKKPAPKKKKPAPKKKRVVAKPSKAAKRTAPAKKKTSSR